MGPLPLADAEALPPAAPLPAAADIRTAAVAAIGRGSGEDVVIPVAVLVALLVALPPALPVASLMIIPPLPPLLKASASAS